MEPVTKALIETGTLGVLLAGALIVIGALATYIVKLQGRFDDYKDTVSAEKLVSQREMLETMRRVSDALASVSSATCSAVSELARETRASITNLERRIEDALARMQAK